MSRVFKSGAIRVNEEKYKIKTTQSKNPLEDEKKEKDIETSLDNKISKEEVAKDIIESAKEEAKNIKEDAKIDIKILKEQAEIAGNQAGFEKGYEEGKIKGEEEANIIKEEAKAILENAKIERQELLLSAEPELVNLIGNITEKLTGFIASTHDDLILVLIKAGLSDATIYGKVSIFVSHEDYNTVYDAKEEIIDSIKGLTELEIIKDNSLHSMDCIIETAYGNIDCSLGEQVEELKKHLALLYEQE